jgi:hypothetical protein
MALGAATIVDVRNGGSDTANGGTFNPGAAFATDLTATSATGNSPVVSSASYNFVAGDVGTWLYIKSGTNWTPGWYQIASVASNQATLSAAIGAALQGPSGQVATNANTVAGCATTASPTAGTWGVDYSQQTAAQFSLTGLTTSGANAIILTSAATKAMIGNGLVITGGTNFTTGYYQITAASAGTSITVDRTCATGVGASGTAGLGGALASPGNALLAANGVLMFVFLKYNASVYSITSASTNVAGGCLTSVMNVYGYSTNRYFGSQDTNRPTLQLNVSSATLLTGASNEFTVWNCILDGNSQTSSKLSASGIVLINCQLNNSNVASTAATYFNCTATGNSASVFNGVCVDCEAFANTATQFVAGTFINCLSYANTGASTDGFVVNQTTDIFKCVAYNNGRDGFNLTAGRSGVIANCISVSNARFGYNYPTGSLTVQSLNCAGYNNTSGDQNGSGSVTGFITLTGDPFVASGSGNFALNNTAGAGALLRAAGFPALFPAGLTATYEDIGAAQHQDSGGSVGGFLIGGGCG